MEAQRRRPGRPLQLEGVPDLAAATSVGALLHTRFAERPKPFTEKQCKCAIHVSPFSRAWDFTAMDVWQSYIEEHHFVRVKREIVAC